ncbi:MAG TPA: protease [Myxococcus sp.]|nr:protease [Myxococcus sp.]
MTRGQVGRAVLLCLGVLGGACTSRKDEAPPAPAPASPGSAAPAAHASPTPETSDAGAAMDRRLECRLSVPETVKAGTPVTVSFALINPTQRALYVLDWHTPLEGLLNDILQVTRLEGGEELSYSGPMFKRGDPAADDYVPVAPGSMVSASIEASLAYDFSKPGRYRIAFRGPLMDVATDKAGVPHTRDGFQSLPVACAPVETTVTK